MPVSDSAHSGVYCSTRSVSCSMPAVWSRTYAASVSPSPMITFIIASARAPSVPGRIGMYQSARFAVRCRTGSITTTFAPRRCASATNGHRCRFVETMLQAQMMM